MNYNDKILEIKDLCIVVDKKNDKAMIHPDYLHVLHLNKISFPILFLDGFTMTKLLLLNTLKLLIDFYNNLDSRKSLLLDWTLDLVNNIISPAILELKNKTAALALKQVATYAANNVNDNDENDEEENELN